jgi:hypothetical protein
MENCSVEWHHSAVLVTFEDGKTLLLQSDWDYIAFAYACGAPIGSGDPSSDEFDSKAWENYDITDITECPDEYYDQAEEDESSQKFDWESYEFPEE